MHECMSECAHGASAFSAQCSFNLPRRKKHEKKHSTLHTFEHFRTKVLFPVVTELHAETNFKTCVFGHMNFRETSVQLCWSEGKVTVRA